MAGVEEVKTAVREDDLLAAFLEGPDQTPEGGAGGNLTVGGQDLPRRPRQREGQ